jgi:hypothetical protein
MTSMRVFRRLVGRASRGAATEMHSVLDVGRALGAPGADTL